MLLCRGMGSVYYANAQALEDRSGSTWARAHGPGTLEGLLACLYPSARKRALANLARAFHLAQRRGRIKVRIALPGPGRGTREWEVVILSLKGQTEESFLLSFQPGGHESLSMGPEGGLLSSSARVARQIQEQAPASPDPPHGTPDPMAELVRWTRGLLATMEEIPAGPQPQRVVAKESW